MKKSGLLDKNGKEICEGQEIIYKGHHFDVLWCNGAFKLMEQKSMFEGACDGWLHEIAGACKCNQKDKKLKEVEIVT